MELQRAQFGRRAQGVAGLKARTQASVAVSADGRRLGPAQCKPRSAAADQRDAGAAARRRQGAAQQPDQGGGAHQWRCRCDRRPAHAARSASLHRLWQQRACSTCSPPTASSTFSMLPSLQAKPMALGEPFAVEGPAGPVGIDHRALSGAGQSGALSRGRGQGG